jgi:16S rRNA (cytosine967-C5)-methyltransferase
MDINNDIVTNESEANDEIVEINEARLAAVKIISRFERSDAYLDKLMHKELQDDSLSQQDKSLLKELVYGVIRWRWKLDWVLTGFYRGDYLKCLNIIKNALRVGLYQILFLDKIPVHAAINESVEIIKRIQGEKIAGVVNGVLRNISRNIENIRYPVKEEDIVYYYTIMKSHPRWMIKEWLNRYGESDTVELLDANNRRPNLNIRINKLRINILDVTNELSRKGIEFFIHPHSEESLTITSRGIDISSLEIFREGKITVQDTSAYLATKLASVKPGQRILDLCSAPGGKSFSLAEQAEDRGHVLSVDKYKSKLRIIEDGAARLRLNSIKTMEADATEIDFNELFDIVFVDAPCSGLGTLSKKPDIKWKREREDIPILASTQREIVKNAVRFVKPGGVLIYSTCTIEPEENEEIVDFILNEFKDFSLDNAENYLTKEVCKKGFMMTFPHIHNIDGAFAARLIKSS